MELTNSKSCLHACLFVCLLLGLLTNFSKAAPSDRLQSTGWTDEDGPNTAWKLAFREELRRELSEYDEAEERIAEKIRELSEERQTIRTKKRGHTQCFLNLVSCYRKRK